MGYKTTTEIYALRDTISITKPTGSISEVTTNEINTSLDSLNREVLLIWEVDFQPEVNMFARAPLLADNMTGDSETIQSMQINKDSGNYKVSDWENICSRWDVISGSGNPIPSHVISDVSPNTVDFASLNSDKAPLAIVASDSIYFRVALDSTITGGGFTAGGSVRLMVQRARADADTYTAILQGLTA